MKPPAASAEVWALHGFTGGGGDFAPLAEAFPEVEWHTPDLPGHALGPRLPGAPGDDCSLENSLRYLDALIPAAPENKRILLGYSLGARLALRYALACPGKFAALILIGVSPGIKDSAERAARRQEDEAFAEKILAGGTAKFLDEWQNRPLIASQRRLPENWRVAMRARRLNLRAEGLAASLRQFGQGALEPVWEQLHELSMPTLLCAGIEDKKYAGFAAEMKPLVPRAEIFLVPNAGHMAHLENRDAFVAGLRAFLQKHRLWSEA